MQPYFFPYIGYFQLIAAADVFIIYDNIKYTKKGWISRNRILVNSEAKTISLPLKNASDNLNVRDRELATSFEPHKLFNQIQETYRHAPYFENTSSILKNILFSGHTNLFDFIHHSVSKICNHLGINTTIIKSSDIEINHFLKNQEKVLALCKSLGAHTYINPIGGVDLYSSQAFKDQAISLKFGKSKEFIYPQFNDSFVPWLSIIDVMMFNSIDNIQDCLSSRYELI